MKMVPLAFESLGVRSMATCVKTEDLNLVIDPSVALAPNRFGFPPHHSELREKEILWENIKKEVKKADILIVTHYHYDHVDPEEPEIYSGKKVFLKHPRLMINPSQKRRSVSFIQGIKRLAKEINYVDNKDFIFGDTKISFSKPLPHGSTAKRGYVIGVSIKEKEKFLYTSDVQGPVLIEQMDFILDESPDILFIDGPTTYIDSQLAAVELRKANENLLKIVMSDWIKCVVVDHHLTRDLDYVTHIRSVIEAGKEVGVNVETAAGFLNIKPKLLEARRRELYQKVEN